MLSLKLHTVIASDNVKHLVEVKARKIFLGPKFDPDRPKSGRKLNFSQFSEVWFISFALHGIE